MPCWGLWILLLSSIIGANVFGDDDWYIGCFGDPRRRSIAQTTPDQLSPPHSENEQILDRRSSNAKSSSGKACKYDVAACCRVCGSDRLPFAVLDPHYGCRCTHNLDFLQRLSPQYCSLQCTQSSPPLFSQLLGESAEETLPRSPPAVLPFGGSNVAFNIYHVRGPFIRDMQLTAGPHYIVEGDEVPFEAQINLESMKNLGIGLNDSLVKILTFDWSIANNVSQERVNVSPTGLASSVRVQTFHKRGIYPIAVVVSNAISFGAIADNITVRSPAPYDLQIRQSSESTPPSCFLYGDGLPADAILEGVYVDTIVRLQAEVTTGRNLTFEWRLLGPDGEGTSKREAKIAPDCYRLSCLINEQTYKFTSTGLHVISVTVSNRHGEITRTIYVAVLERKTWNPSFLIHEESPSTTTTTTPPPYVATARAPLNFVFSFQSSFGPDIPLLFDLDDGTKFRLSDPPSSPTGNPRVERVFDNHDCRVSVLLRHAFVDEGDYLPNVVVESPLGRMRVELDKRVGVFQILDGPIINASQAVETKIGHRFAVQLMNKPSRKIRYEWRATSSNSSFSFAFGPSSSPYLDIVFPFPDVYTLWVNSSNPVSFVAATEEVSAEDSIRGLEASTNHSEYLAVGETLRVKAWVRSGTKVKFKWKFEPHSQTESSRMETSHVFLTTGIYNIIVEASNPVSFAMFELGDYIVEDRIRTLLVGPVVPLLVGRPFQLRVETLGGSSVRFEVDFGDGDLPIKCESVVDNACVLSYSYDVAGFYVISVHAHNHVSWKADSVGVTVERAVPEVSLSALGGQCLPKEPCLFAAKLANGSISPQSTFVYEWDNQWSPPMLDSSPVHSIVFPTPGNHRLSLRAFNGASNVTASLVAHVASAPDPAPRLQHPAHTPTDQTVNFTLKNLPANAKRILFVTTRTTDSATRLSTHRGPSITWSFSFPAPTVESLSVVIKDKDDGELARILSAITIEDPIRSLAVEGPAVVSWGIGHRLPIQWTLVQRGGSSVFYQASLPAPDDEVDGTNGDVVTQIHPTFRFKFPRPGRYQIRLAALNSVSRAETRHSVRVMHPVRVLDLAARSPLVGVDCVLEVIVQGQTPLDLLVDWGDGGTPYSFHLNASHPSLRRFLRNGVNPRLHVEAPQILGFEDVFRRVYSRVGHYTVTVNASNPVSSHGLSVTIYVDERIDEIRLTPLSPYVLVIGSGVNGAAARVRVDVASGSNLTFGWDFGDGAGYRTQQEDGQNYSIAHHVYTDVGEYLVNVSVKNHVDGPKFVTRRISVAESISAVNFVDNEYYATDSLAPFDPASSTSRVVRFSVDVDRGSGVKLLFDFGDGSTEVVDPQEDWNFMKLIGVARHVYRRVGAFDVRVTAFNVLGNVTATLSSPVVVQVPPTGLRLETKHRDGFVTLFGTATDFKATLRNGTDVKFSWDFGDGSKLDNAGPTHRHRYERRPVGAAYFNVTVVARNRAGTAAERAKVFVQTKIQAVELTLPSTPQMAFLTGKEVTFAARASPPDAVDYYAWDFGDDDLPKQTRINTTTHVFSAAERVLAKVTAWNKLGQAVSSHVALTLFDPVEVVSVVGSPTSAPGQATRFEVRFWRGTRVSCLWDFGDGSQPVFAPACESGHVRAHRYESGGKFDVFVSVNNSLSSSRASVVHFVVGYDCQPPRVEIDSPSVPLPGHDAGFGVVLCNLKLTPKQPVWIEPRVKVSCAKTQTVRHRWSVWRFEDGERTKSVRLEDGLVTNLDHRSIYLPEGSLDVGHYVLDVHVSMNGTILEANASCKVDITDEPLKLFVDGGSFKQVFVSEAVVVNSRINRKSLEGIALAWDCYPLDGFGKPCFLSSVPLPTNVTSVSVPASSFDVSNGAAFVFNLTATTAGANASVDQVIQIVDRGLLSLAVECDQCRSGRVNSNERLYLRALCNGAICDRGAVELKWSLSLVLDGSQQDFNEVTNGCMRENDAGSYIARDKSSGATFRSYNDDPLTASRASRRSQIGLPEVDRDAVAPGLAEQWPPSRWRLQQEPQQSQRGQRSGHSLFDDGSGFSAADGRTDTRHQGADQSLDTRHEGLELRSVNGSPALTEGEGSRRRRSLGRRGQRGGEWKEEDGEESERGGGRDNRRRQSAGRDGFSRSIERRPQMDTPLLSGQRRSGGDPVDLSPFPGPDSNPVEMGWGQEGASGGRQPNNPAEPETKPDPENPGPVIPQGTNAEADHVTHVIRMRDQRVTLAAADVATPTDSPQLVINADVLKPGRTYIVRVTASSPGGWSRSVAPPTSTSLTVVRVNRGPFKGKCAVSPDEGVEAETPFRLICYEWKDEDDSHLPLTYQIDFRTTPFGLKTWTDDARGANLIYSGLKRDLTFRLPAGNADRHFLVYLRVAVFDALGARTPVCAFPVKVRSIASMISHSISGGTNLQSPKSEPNAEEETGDADVNRQIEFNLKNEIFGCASLNLSDYIHHGDVRLARIRIQYLATQMNRLEPLAPTTPSSGHAEESTTAPPPEACDVGGGAACCDTKRVSNQERLLLRSELRLQLLRRLAPLPVRHPTEALQTLTALARTTLVSDELSTVGVAVAADVLNKAAESVVFDRRGVERSTLPQGMSTLAPHFIDGVVGAFSNLLESIVNGRALKESADIAVRAEKVLTGVVKLEVGATRVPNQAPLISASPFVKILGVKLSGDSARDGTGDGTQTLAVENVTFVFPRGFVAQALLSLSTRRDDAGRSRSGRAAIPPPDCLMAIIINYRGNPFLKDALGPEIVTVVSSIRLFSCHADVRSNSATQITAKKGGHPFEIRLPIKEDVASKIPASPNFWLPRSRMNVHPFNVTRENLGHALRVTVRLDPLPATSGGSKKHHFPLALLVGEKDPPTPTKYIKKWVFDRKSERLDLFLDSFFNETGIHYLAIADATFNSGRPRKDEIRERHYEVDAWWTRCLEWGVDNGWSSGTCQTLNTTTIRSAHCRCERPSSVYGSSSLPVRVLRDDVVSLDVNVFFPTSNHAIPAALSLLLFVALFVFAFAWRADVADDVKTQVIYLPDNDPSHLQAYQITVETGFRRGAGTTSRVSIVLHGADGMSETRELVAFHSGAASARHPEAKAYQRVIRQSARRLFARNSRDTFVITVPKSLGPIWKVQVWHDNSGASPSWFLSRIVVEDLTLRRTTTTTTRTTTTFVADKWFAVEEDDGKVEREILAAEGPIDKRLVFKAKFCQYLTDFHLWASIVTRPSYSRFTRCQRCAVCLALLLGYMALSAFWCFYREEEYRGELALLDVSWRTVAVGSFASLSLFVFQLLVVAIFRRSKVKRYHATSGPSPLRRVDPRLPTSTSVATAASSGEVDDDDDRSSRLGNRSVDGLVGGDAPGDTQLIAYSVFEQTLQTWQTLQEWAQRAWAKHYPHHVDPDGREVAQVVKQVVGRGRVRTEEPTLGPETAFFPRPPKFPGPEDYPFSGHPLEPEITDIAFPSLRPSAGLLPSSASMVTARPPHSSPPSARADRRRLFLPPQWRWVAWFLCVAASVAAAFFTVSLGVKFGRRRATIWLQAVYFAFVQSVFIIHPLMVLLMSLAAACRPGDEEDVFDFHDDGFIECETETEFAGDDPDEIHRERGSRKDPNYPGAIFYLYTSEEEVARGLAARQRSRHLRFARPPAERHLIRARETTMKEKTVAALLLEFVVYVIVLAVLALMAFGGHQGNSIFGLQRASRSAFVDSPSTPFSGVSSVASWWDWAEGDFLDAMFGDSGGGGGGVDEDSRLWVLGGNAFVVGDVVMKQSRISLEFCPTGHVIIPGLRDAKTICNPAYSPASSSSSSSSSSARLASPRFNLEAFLPFGPNLTWTFSDRHRDWSSSRGIHGLYSEGGYIFQFPRSSTDARRELKHLRDSRWIDRQTRAVSVFFTLFSPASNLFTSVSLLTETPPSGGVFVRPSVSSTTLFRYVTPWDSVRLVLEIFFLFLFLSLAVSEIHAATGLGPQAYFRSACHAARLAFVLLCGAYQVCLVYRFFEAEFIIEELRATHYDAYVDVSYVAFWDEVLSSLLGMLLFLFLLQSLRLLRFLRGLTRVTRALSRSTRDVASMALAFVGVIVVFAALGLLLFSSDANFATFSAACGSLASALAGLYSLKDIGTLKADVFYFAFLVVSFGVVFAFGAAILSKHLRREARRHRRRMERRLKNGVGTTAAPDNAWGKALGARDIANIAWSKFLVWAGFRPAPEWDKPMEGLSAEFILAEFEFQIDELLQKLDSISGAVPPCSAPPLPSASIVKPNTEPPLAPTHGVHPNLEHRLNRIEDDFSKNDADWAKLIDLGTFGVEDPEERQEKELRAALEMEIFRQLQLAPPEDDSTLIVAALEKGVDSSTTAPRNEADGDQLLQLLGLDPEGANSAAATEILLANFSNSMQREQDLLADPFRAEGNGIFHVMNDIPYHPPNAVDDGDDVEVDIPYHGPSSGDQDSLQSDEISIPDWTTPPPPPRSNRARKRTKESKILDDLSYSYHSAGGDAPYLSGGDDIPYYPPLESGVDDSVEVTVEIPGHLLDDEEEEEEEEGAESKDFAKVNMAYFGDHGSPPPLPKSSRSFAADSAVSAAARLPSGAAERPKAAPKSKSQERDSFLDETASARSRGTKRGETRPLGRRLHKTRSRGKGKFLSARSEDEELEAPTSRPRPHAGNHNLAFNPTSDAEDGETKC